MLDWIKNNSELLMVVANFGTLLIWLFYAQLLFLGYRRERRPRILINKGVGAADLDAPCLICNMSKEPVFVQSILVELATNDGRYLTSATDTEEGEQDTTKTSIGRRTRQGPLESGVCLEVPSFRILLQKGADAAGVELQDGLPVDPEVKLEKLTVTVVAIYGPEDDPFGAERVFGLDCEDRQRVRLRPETLDTERLNSRLDKRRLKDLVGRYN
ncbi:hypothetical protein [Hydrocarboniclastica marina]|uniref:Uncharacterized protein n=1 Tax=Hydrocarboniclastica marina TaxID=2259620 RepID=A0A4P7XHR5_9ALTE|nr:hypothetical protein [Hydrocarboniclastica marina]QCF25782.1 hypothetical protein soil367_07540 [Hydrocarboniclastica marina]